MGLGVGAIARPHPINDPDHLCLRGENSARQAAAPSDLGSSLLARGKHFLICDYIRENAQILETSGCGFAVFSGVAGKNASEPVEQSAR